ncbi:MAG: hypothetical protein QOF55_1751, partial [Thermoleophilaceae bacterium]|nr:hypothetical protein [Thermoleophilaceae bacterium]
VMRRELALAAGDTLTVVDNRGLGVVAPELLVATGTRTSYFARNRGAEGGGGDWIVFLDADVEPPPGLIDRYFEPQPDECTAVLAGGVLDEPLEHGAQATAAARYAVLRDWMSQENSLGAGPWAYAQTANCAVRRRAFEDVGGFRDHLRSGGDGDICFRLRAAGWSLEPRDGARVVHRSRRLLRAMLRQRARHGSGAAWLNREHPGSFPRRPWPGLAKWTVQSFGRAPLHALRGRRDDALLAVVDPLEQWAFELGRLAPNEVRPRRRRRAG